MKKLGENELWSYCDEQKGARRIDRATDARKAKGHVVKSYFELATKVAELQFQNPDHILMFRGQGADHLNYKGKTTLKPSLFRSRLGSKLTPDMPTLAARYDQLTRAEGQLLALYKRARLMGVARLARHRMLRWAILQHYEVCATPLLDITQSLRIAASFASESEKKQSFVYVLAIPNLSGAITASAEAGLQIIRLSSVCPPSARRPHIQEGYLLGEYPDMASYDQKELYGHYEIDFGRRLLAKFKFDPAAFWRGDTFPRVAHEALYPDTKDPLCRLAQKVKNAINHE